MHQSKSISSLNSGVNNTLNSAFQTCTDTSDAIELFVPQQLYLKPVAKLNVSVQLPQLKLPGKTISNWEVMEKLKSMVKPVQFTVLKVSKSTLEFIRFEGEIENKSNLNEAIGRLDGRTIKLSGFSELLKIRAAEAKNSFPTRHTWDSYFRDAKNMNEMKPGERPDTIHLSNLPSRWFSSRQENGRGSDKPNEYVFRKIFEQFGEVRCVDIPMLDPYRSQMKAHISGLKTFSFGQELAFEGYVQYQEYVCFVKAMDALRGMKLLHKEGDKAYTASIKVDFDQTKHLSDASIRKRRLERERLMAKEREQEEQDRRTREEAEKQAEIIRKQKEEEEQLKAQLAEERRQRKAERHQARQLRRLKREEAQRMNYKIAVEERKLLIAQRKLESIRLLDELFERVKVLRLQEVQKKQCVEESKESKEKDEKEDMEKKERELRSKLMKKYKSVQELQLKGQQEKLRQTVEGRSKVQSTLASGKYTKDANESDSSTSSSSSHTSLSSENDTNRKYKVQDERKDRNNDSDVVTPWLRTGQSAPEASPLNSRSGLTGSTDQTSAFGFNQSHGNRLPMPHREMHGRKRRWPQGPRGRGSYTSSNYYYGMTDDYYKYFSKLASQRGRSRSRSRSRSPSRSRSRHRRRSDSNSKSSRRSRSKSRRSKSSRRSRSRSRNHSRRSPVRSRSKSASRSRTQTQSTSSANPRKLESLSGTVNSVSKSQLLNNDSNGGGKTPSVIISSKSVSKSHQANAPSSSMLEAKPRCTKRSATASADESKTLSLSKSTVVPQSKNNSENGISEKTDPPLKKRVEADINKKKKKKKHKHKKEKEK